MKALLPSRALGIFLLIGFIDLITTAVLHAKGLIVELNPIMRVFIDRGEWLFAFVKGATLVAGWVVLSWYAKTNPEFVKKISLMASGAYVTIWLVWFVVNL